MPERNKLDIRNLLKGTVYEDKAEVMAQRIENNHWDNDKDIWSMPRGGAKFFGENVYDVLNVITERAKEEQAKVERTKGVDEDPEPEAGLVTEAALKLAQKHDIDLSSVQGTGKDSVVVKADVEKLIA